MEKGKSEFDAPIYSVLSEERIGTEIVKIVVLEDELMTFRVPRDVYAAGKALEDKSDE